MPFIQQPREQPNNIMPLFAEPLHVGRPNLGDRETLLARIAAMLDRRVFSNGGPLVQEFEVRVASLLGVRHCIATCNATVALEIVGRALDLHGEVIVPSFTFVATAHAFRWLGLRPVFADIDPATHNLDPASVESLVTPSTSAIVGVHLWGRPCDTDGLASIASRHRIPVVYDAAHAFACSHRGRMLGGFGTCEVLSFHATKFVNTFEGGAVVTNDDALAQRLRLARNFGFTGLDQVGSLGINGKMPEVCAAMGLSSLEVLDDLIAINRRNFEAYQLEFAQLPGITLIAQPCVERRNFQYVVAEVDAATAGRTRDQLLVALRAENVLARRYFWPGCHRMEPYRTEQPTAGAQLPVTEQIAERVLVLPTGQAVTPKAISAIAAILRHAIKP